MRNLKKVLVLVLSLAMMLGIMVTGVSAATFTDNTQIDSKHQEAVDMAVTLNIINGYPDGSFKPNDSVSREEMAKMICILDNGGKEPQLATGNRFTDVAADRWSNKYIEACAARGVVAGVGNNMFNPDGKVTATQAAKMLLVELGYDEDLAKYTGSNWATNVNVDATKRGYYDDLEDIDVTAPLSREHAAQMVWNALQANEVEYKNTLTTDPVTGQLTSKVEVQDKTVGAFGAKITLLADKYDVTDDETGQMIRFSYNSNKAEWTYTFRTAGNTYGVANTLSFANFTSSTDYTDLYLQNVKVVYKNNADRDVMGMFAEKSKVLSTCLVDKMDLSGMKTDSIKIDGVSYDYGVSAANAAQNETQVQVYEYRYGANATPYVASLAALAKGVQGPFEIQAIDYDDNDDINFFIIHPFDVQKVTNVGSKSFSAGATYKFDDVTVYDGIAKDDYVKITAAANTYDNTAVFEKVAEVSDTAKSVNKSNDVNFSGEWYKVKTDKLPGANPVAGTDYDYVAVNGYLFYLDGSSLGDVNDFLVVTAASAAGSGVDNTFSTKVLKADGKETTVPVISVNGANARPTVGALYYFEQDDDDYYVLTDASETYVRGATTNGSAYPGTYAGTNYKKTVDFDVVRTAGTRTVTATIDSATNVINGNFTPVAGSDNKNYILDGGTRYYFNDDAKFFVDNISGKVTATGATVYTNDNGTTWFTDAACTTAYAGGLATLTISHDYDVISGTKMKTTAEDPTVLFFAADENSDSKYTNVVMAYVYNNGGISSGDTNYGYVTDDAVKAQAEGSSTKYNVTIKFWDGEKDQTLVTKDAANTALINNAANLEAGDVFSYELNDDGKIDKIVVYGSAYSNDLVNPATGKIVDAGNDAGVLETGAISGFNKTDKLVTFNNQFFFQGVSTAHQSGVATGVVAPADAADLGLGNVSTQPMKITSDTVIMFVDSSDNSGETGTLDAIQIAITDSLGKAGVGIGPRSTQIANAMFIESTVANELDLLIIDVNNDLLDLD